MNDRFDPLHKWFGIAPEEQPPTHYRLLGLRVFEDDPDIIDLAADRIMAQLRQHQTGRHSTESQLALNLVSSARVCLLDKARKADYDAKLLADLPSERDCDSASTLARASSRSLSMSPWSMPLAVDHKPILKKRQQSQVVMFSVAAAVVAIGVIVLLVVFVFSPTAESTPQELPKNATTTIAKNKPENSPTLTPLAILPGTANPVMRVPSHMIAPVGASQAVAHQREWATTLKVPIESTNSIGMVMIVVPPGEFGMGVSPDEAGQANKKLKDDAWAIELIKAEMPQHRVRISRPFLCSKTEITHGQFETFVRSTNYETDAERNGKGGQVWENGAWRLKLGIDWRTPGLPGDNSCPVVQVSWNDAIAFCRWLSAREHVTYRLPTEAEWEYACRAGTVEFWESGDKETDLDTHAWFSGNCSGDWWKSVGTKLPNRWGFYDMHGNAWEWCEDWFAESYYASSPSSDPTGPPFGERRVIRGGSGEVGAWTLRSAARCCAPPGSSYPGTGFRVVCETREPPTASVVR